MAVIIKRRGVKHHNIIDLYAAGVAGFGGAPLGACNAQNLVGGGHDGDGCNGLLGGVWGRPMTHRRSSDRTRHAGAGRGRAGQPLAEGAPAPCTESEARPVVRINEAAFGELVAGRVARLRKPDGGKIEVTLTVSWDRVLETIVRAIEARARRV